MAGRGRLEGGPSKTHGVLPLRRFAIRATCAVGVLLNVSLACNLFLPGAWRGRNDFLGFYVGARLAGSTHLYDRESVRLEQLRVVGETGEIQYGRLPVYALVLKPLAWLPYPRAYLIWEILSAAAFAGFIALWPGVAPPVRWLVCCWSLPAFVGLFNGQDDLLLLLCTALAARLLRAGKPATAGIVLALFTASKFHLFVLVPLVLLAQRRWRMAAGAAACISALLAISFGVAGKDWVRALYALVADPRVSTGLDHMPNLHSLLAPVPLGFPLQIAASLALAAGVFLVARRSNSFEWHLGLALAAGVLVAHHGYLHDGAMFLPAIMAFSDVNAKYARFLALTLATPIPWCVLHLTRPLPALTQLMLLAFVITGIAWLWSVGREKTARAPTG